MTNSVMCIITNFNLDREAKLLYDIISPLCTTYVLDNSGIEKDGFIATYNKDSGMNFKSGCDIFMKSDFDYCLFICSDVSSEHWNEIISNIKELDKRKIGLYTPVVNGCSHRFLKNKGTKGLRDVPFAEGMILCANKTVIRCIYNTIRRTYMGWGLDIYIGWKCQLLSYKCVADERVSVFHPFGKGYDKKYAQHTMKNFIKTTGSDFESFCHNANIGLPLLKRLFYKTKLFFNLCD